MSENNEYFRVPWVGLLLPLNTQGNDGRKVKHIEPLPHQPLPLPLMAKTGNYEPQELVGNIEELWIENNAVLGRGFLNAEHKDQMAFGISNRLLAGQGLPIRAILEVKSTKVAFYTTSWIFIGAAIVGESVFTEARIYHANQFPEIQGLGKQPTGH